MTTPPPSVRTGDAGNPVRKASEPDGICTGLGPTAGVSRGGGSVGAGGSATGGAGAGGGGRDALAEVTAIAPHLRWRTAADLSALGADELPCSVLAADVSALAAAVAASADGRGSDDPQVLASLWWQAYAYRVAGTALACWLLTGTAPDVRAEATAIGVARSRPSSVVYLAASGTGVDPAVTDDLGTFVGWLFAGHLDRVAGTLRARHQLGAQLVWGNVAAACASGVGAVHESAPPDWPDRLADFLAAAPHGLAALGRWSFGAPDEARGPEFRRRTCCLWWKTTVAAGALCADCSLHAREPSPPTPSPSVSPPPRPAGPSAAPTPGSTSPA